MYHCLLRTGAAHRQYPLRKLTVTIVCDRHIPFLAETIRCHWPAVTLREMEAEAIDAAAVQDADALVIRTRTAANARLLEGSSVKLVCTATIGYDHIDTAWCEQHQVAWTACPGCNAQAVCDYVEETLCELHATGTIGIVGVGHVGTLVARMAEKRGMNVLLNDPPKNIGVSLAEIAQKCDVITFHTPLTRSGDYPTFHLCDAELLAQTKPNTLIINAARGGIVDETALLNSGRRFVLDTWENEPLINKEVAITAQRASMHIAGYSQEGKRNATQMCLDAIADMFGLPKITLPHSLLASELGDSAPGWLERITAQLQSRPEHFETLRRNYLLR